MCQTVPAQQRMKFVVSTECTECVCVSVCRYGCESWIICGVHPLHECSFQGFGKSSCTGNKELQRSDPVLADISQNIAGHSGNKKLPSYGNSACMHKPNWKTQRESPLSPLASFYFCYPCLHISVSFSQSLHLFSHSDFLLTWFNFLNPPFWWNNDAA